MEILILVFVLCFLWLFAYVMLIKSATEKQLDEIEKQLRELDWWSQK